MGLQVLSFSIVQYNIMLSVSSSYQPEAKRERTKNHGERKSDWRLHASKACPIFYNKQCTYISETSMLPPPTHTLRCLLLGTPHYTNGTSGIPMQKAPALNHASTQSAPLSFPDSLDCYRRQCQSVLSTCRITDRIRTLSDPDIIRLKLVKPIKH